MPIYKSAVCFGIKLEQTNKSDWVENECNRAIQSQQDFVVGRKLMLPLPDMPSRNFLT